METMASCAQCGESVLIVRSSPGQGSDLLCVGECARAYWKVMAETDPLPSVSIEERLDDAEDFFAELTRGIVCSECGVEMPDDAYARTFGRCAKHADGE